MPPRALVTGSAGFIGAHVTRALVQRGYCVRALVLAGEDTRNLADLEVERVVGDVTSPASLASAMKGVDVVFHLAAVFSLWREDAPRMLRVNVEGTRLVLEAARRARVDRVVHTSSIARFGGQGPRNRATERSPFALGGTRDVYARTKADAHEIAVSAARQQDVVVVAPCGPIGPGDVGPTPTGRLLLSALTQPVALVADTATCFGDVRDMADAHVAAAERGRRGEAYLLGDEDWSMRDVAREALDVAGRAAPIVCAPLALARWAGRAAEVAARLAREPPLLTRAAVEIAALGLRADCSKSHRELGAPRSSVRRAIGDAVRWFAREGYLARERYGAREGARSTGPSARGATS